MNCTRTQRENRFGIRPARLLSYDPPSSSSPLPHPLDSIIQNTGPRVDPFGRSTAQDLLEQPEYGTENAKKKQPVN